MECVPLGVSHKYYGVSLFMFVTLSRNNYKTDSAEILSGDRLNSGLILKVLFIPEKFIDPAGLVKN